MIIGTIDIQIAIWLPNLRFTPNFRCIQQQNLFFLRQIIIFRTATAHFRSEIRFLLRKTPEIRAFSEALIHIPICGKNKLDFWKDRYTRCSVSSVFFSISNISLIRLLFLLLELQSLVFLYK